MYNENMLCKHFKGKDLLNKNIYRIVKLNVCAKDLNFDEIIYSGDNENYWLLENLVVYENIFTGQIFAREYSDLSKVLSDDKQKKFNQVHAVEPLSSSEEKLIQTDEFIYEKKQVEIKKGRKVC